MEKNLLDVGGRLVMKRVISSSGVIEEIEIVVEKVYYVGIEIDIWNLPQVKKNMAACVF